MQAFVATKESEEQNKRVVTRFIEEMWNQRKLEQAEPWYREALATGRRVLGEDHPDTTNWASSLATLLMGQGKYAEASCFPARWW